MKVILGGGLVALLARDILGSDWSIIPYGKSRFYSFSPPPICDNYVIKDKIIDDYMDKYALIPIYTRNAYSIGGHLTQNTHIALEPWLNKVYGKMVPPHAESYWRGHGDYFAYGDCLEIYRRLQSQYIEEILGCQEKIGKSVTKIIPADHRLKTDVGEFQYDEIVSTIPLPILTTAMGLNYEFPARDLWCYHLRTEWDTEGATHLLVVDPHIEFFKMTKVNQTNYIFYSSEKIVQPGRYFMAFLKKFELVGEVHFEDAMPCGPIPNLAEVAAAGIRVIGSRAAWDDCMDIGTCIKRLVKNA